MHDPTKLDRSTLQALRSIVKTMNREPQAAVPLADLAKLNKSLPDGIALTVDFEASRELGHEMIVLCVPSAPSAAGSDSRLAALSARELEIAKMVASGLGNKEIARKLFVSLATVKSHVHHILVKTALPNRAAIAAAYHGRSERSLATEADRVHQ